MDSILKQNIIIVIAIALLSTFSDCGYCPVSVPTVTVVSKCPTTKTEWDEAANRKKCTFMSASTNCDNKMPVYHCLLNQWKNETVEVCASTWYISGFCAIYNSDEMKVFDDFKRDCTKFTDGRCPTRYISTDAYMYQRCYEKQDTRTSMPSTDKQPQVLTVCTLPIAIGAILSILLIILLVLLLLTCLGKIPKSCNIGTIMMDTQCMRSSKNNADEERGNGEKRPEWLASEGQDDGLHGEETNKETSLLLPNVMDTQCMRSSKNTTDEERGNGEKRPESLASEGPDDGLHGEETINGTNTLLPNDTCHSTKETSTRDENLRRVNNDERGLTFDAGDTTNATITKDEDPNKESLEEGTAIIDAGDTINATITKDEDPNKESLEEGTAIIDERTDFHNDDQAVESNVEEPESDEDNAENFFNSSTGTNIDRDSSSSSSSKSQSITSSKEDQSDPKETPNVVKKMVENINKMNKNE